MCRFQFTETPFAHHSQDRSISRITGYGMNYKLTAGDLRPDLFCDPTGAGMGGKAAEALSLQLHLIPWFTLTLRVHVL
jgi:hypothetical protein